MSYVDNLRARRNSPKAIFHRFKLERQPEETCVFLEGADDAEYYMPAIRQFVASPIRLYVCDGKETVLSVSNLIAEAGADRCLFFVDADLDRFIQEKPLPKAVYVTDGYSIENEVAARETLERFLQEVVQVEPAEDLFQKAIEAFECGWHKLRRVLRPCMAAAIAIRQKLTDSSSEYQKPVLSNFSPSDVLAFDGVHTKLSHARVVKHFMGKIKNEVELEPSTILNVFRRVRKESDKVLIRGKYLLWYFVEFLKRYWESIKGKQNAHGRKIKVRLQITADNCFSVLGGRYTYPASLTAYIRSRVAA